MHTRHTYTSVFTPSIATLPALPHNGVRSGSTAGRAESYASLTLRMLVLLATSLEDSLSKLVSLV